MALRLRRVMQQVAAATPSRAAYTSTASNAEALTEDLQLTRHVVLNRPAKLNSLNLPMIRALTPVYQRWIADRPSAPILMTGSGERAFCAGGDIHSLVVDPVIRRDFFLCEYRLNLLVSQYPGPHVALWRGIVMGGGVGLSIHGSHRVATDTSVFAMPETAIGLFPDVGGSHALPRLRTTIPNMGMYLALTGGRLKGFELKEAGAATHFVPLARLAELEDAIRNLDPSQWPKEPEAAKLAMDALLAQYEAPPPAEPTALATHRDAIAHCFGGDSVEAILARLEEDGSPWAAATAALLQKCSPTSLKVTFEAQRRGAALPDLQRVLEMEFNLSQACMREGSDFFEGVRAVLIDKDQKPRWNPATLAEVDSASVAGHFHLPAGVAPWTPLP
eukprot:EG_transcript_11577